MTTKKDLLNKHKKTLLSELESIKSSLDEDALDHIPVLEDAIPENGIAPQTELNDTLESEHTLAVQEKAEPPATQSEIADPEIVTQDNSVLPGQQALFQEAPEPTKRPLSSNESLAKNPFLPAHVRQKFEQAAETNTIPEPILTAGETAATTALPAINHSYTEQLVDQLVAQQLPKLEAELRKRLLAVAKLHEERAKKE